MSNKIKNHVLARKWRPQTFSELVGQDHVVRALTYALSQQKIHHAYLLTGTRGVGKTSIARIFAKSLNCETHGVSANPCGQCPTCQDIELGKFVDLIEVDAASRTGVEETRELIDSVSYLPSKGKYKVYLIDEVHMFSKSSFNALLKTLEEPPEYVKFILATTDPDKLPITILSRCLQFNLKALTPAQISQHLATICDSEGIVYDAQALNLLAKAGNGSMRDTLSMTDQAIAYGEGALQLNTVTEILGTIHPADIEAILFAIATNNPHQLHQALQQLENYDVDARTFLIEMMQRLQQMAWVKEGIAQPLSPALQSTVNDIPKALLHLWYDIAEKALPHLTLTDDPRQAVEMVLLRMLAFIPDSWIVRHRTLLPHSEPIAQAVHAVPVKTQDDLESAEATFSKETTSDGNHTENNVNVNDNNSHEPIEKASNEAPVVEVANAPTAQTSNEALNSEPPTPKAIADESVPQSADEGISDEPAADDVVTENNSEATMPPTITNDDDNLSDTNTDSVAPQTTDDVPPWEDLPNEIQQQPESDVLANEIPNEASDTQQPFDKQPNPSNPSLETFDWYVALPQLGLGDYSKHLASLGILRLKQLKKSIEATLDLPPQNQVLITEESREEIKNALQNYFNTPIKFDIHLTAIEEISPNERDKQLSEAQEAQLQQTFQQEPITKTLLSSVAGEILTNTVKPINN